MAAGPGGTVNALVLLQKANQMTTITPPTSVTFIGVENGLTYTITVFQEPGGGFYAQIDVLEGAADFNALYFGDDIADGSSFSFGKSLGMNGAGEIDNQGNPVDWDFGIKLSDPGLGKMGLSKDTYLTAGETMIVSLPGVDSFADVAEIGVRATSTSTPSGSIKTVLEPVDVVDEPEEPTLIDHPVVIEAVEATPLEVTPAAVLSDPPPADAPITAEQSTSTDPDVTLSTADADAAFYEDFANTVGIIEDAPPVEDDTHDVYTTDDFLL